MSKILENAILSIENGVEDFVSPDPGRHLSAIRNVYAGVLLLCKEVLVRMSPNGDGRLIYRQIIETTNADGSSSFKPTGHSTVDRREIEQLFKKLGLDLDWKQLKSLADIRNDIEHRYSDKPEHLIKEALADSLPLITDLISRHLGSSPKEELSDDCWSTLLDNKKVYDAEKKICEESFEHLDWNSDEITTPSHEFRCTECGSNLLMQEEASNTKIAYTQFVCRQCGERPSEAEVISEALAAVTEWQAYIAMTDGGDAPVCDCPECGNYSFVRDLGECVVCEFELACECAVCGNPIGPEDYNPDYPSLCGYHAYTAEKARYD